MMRNYRSTPEILNAANSLISRNRDRVRKDLIPCRESGPMPVCHFAENAESEADWIADKILEFRAGAIPFRDICILYRAHYVTRAVEEALIRKKIPYVIYSGTQFFSRMEIKDALCYLRMAVYRDDLSFLRIVNKPRRNMGERRIAWLKAYQEKNGGTLYDALKNSLGESIFRGTGAAEFVRLIDREAAEYAGKPVSETLAELVDKSGYERALRTEGNQERLDNLAELRQSVYDYETSCGEECTAENYLTHAAMFTSSDVDETGDRVKLMTIHTAKGLEFPCVFLCGMNEGIFPSRKVRTRQGMEEERRLAFVALTRAENRLCITEASGRNFDGMPRYPSRFILDIDAGCLEFTRKPTEQETAEAHAYIRSSEQRLRDETEDNYFAPGTRVIHRVFGAGVIESLDLDREAYLVRFDQISTPRAISFRAKLEKASE
jgi:DNA helicase-2/ATP-dependent DNA helicase PcrA